MLNLEEPAEGREAKQERPILQHPSNDSKFPIPSFTAVQALGAQIRRHREAAFQAEQEKNKTANTAPAQPASIETTATNATESNIQALSFTHVETTPTNPTEPSDQSDRPAPKTGFADLYVVDLSGPTTKTYQLTEISKFLK
jgi:hypothetical protein